MRILNDPEVHIAGRFFQRGRFALLSIFLCSSALADEALINIKPFFKQHCVECHGSDKQKGEIRLDTLDHDLSRPETLEIWQGVLDQLNLGEMPPKKQPRPDMVKIREVVNILTQSLAQAYAKARSTGGETVLRRLNRHELRNSFRDLLYLNGADYRPDAAGSRLIDNNGNGSVERTGNDPLRFFPEDEEEDGFFNLGDKLVMSDFLLKLTLGAVEEVLNQATHLEPRPKVEIQHLKGHLSKPRGRELEAFCRELHPDFTGMYRNEPLRPDVLGRGLPVSARYRITVEASSHNQKHPWGEILPTNQNEPLRLSLSLRKGRELLPVTQWNVKGDGQKQTYRVEAWIDQQWVPELNWENGPTKRELRTDLLMKKYRADQATKAPDRKVITDKKEYEKANNEWWRQMSLSLLKNFEGPSLRIHSLKIEPLIGEWPPKSHTALYGSGLGEEKEIRRLMMTFAERAFRRSVKPELIEPYIQLVLKQKVEPVVTLPGGIQNLSYRVYEGQWSKLPDFEALKPVADGKILNGLIDLKLSKRKEKFGVVFVGTLNAPKDGQYVFEMASDDGGRILINGKKAVEHDGLHGAQLKKGNVNLKAGKHAIRVEYFAYGQPNSFRAGWGGAGMAHTQLSVDSLRVAKNDQKKRDEVPLLIRALQDGYAAILCSPQFLYLEESSGQLDDFALASRLSYFLWSSMPDETLFALARSGKLSQPAELRRQVDRMLTDPKGAAFIQHFPSAWLRLDKLGSMPPSGGDYQFYKNLRVEPMLSKQVTTYFADILKANGRIEEFIDSDYTYMNQVLGKWIYRREDVRGAELQKVSLEDPRRGGIFTLPGLMTATANGVDTSPVVRGVWVLENILGTPPAPPPPDVEPLPTDTRGASSIRERLDLHRENEACASCHRKIDPMGFAFENFDVVGRWRDKYRGDRESIDASAVMANGDKITNIVEFKKMLKDRKLLIVRNLTGKMLTYATGRKLEATDRGEVNQIVSQLAKKEDRLKELVHLVVQSKTFRSK